MPILWDALGIYAQKRAGIMVSRLQQACRMARLEADFRFYIGPELSVSSNAGRTNDGFVFGGILFWTSARRLALPGLRPNGCGVLLCDIGQNYEEAAFVERIIRARKNRPKTWDYNGGNHFIAVYNSRGRYYGLIHGGTARAKDPDNPRGSLYPEINRSLRLRMRRIATPHGQVDLLLDEDAVAYCSRYQQIEALIKRNRENLGRQLWPASRIIFHETHQGLRDAGTMLLGAYLLSKESIRNGVPIMIGLGEPLLFCTQGIELHRAPCVRSRWGPTSAMDENMIMIPHGSGDTNDAVRAVIPYEDHYAEAVLRNGGRAILQGNVPTPDHRSQGSLLAYFRQYADASPRKLKHLLTCKI